MDNILTALSINAGSCIRECQTLIREVGFDVIQMKLESLVLTIRTARDFSFIPWAEEVILKLETAIELLINSINEEQMPCRHLGRPVIPIPLSGIELLLTMRFKVTDMAKFYGVSRHTIFRRLREHGMSVAATYTTITDDLLQEKVIEILTTFPNTGYKRMKGFLLEIGIRVTDLRVRETMRVVDPEGVFQRTLSNRAIVRRQYYVSYFNQLWHLDTNMKLIRWNIVIRSCIDGKSRLVTYLHCSGDNTAESNLVAFLKATVEYGVPYRTRSDKGGENVLIAQFMLEQRGLGRSSHICGRSVHNQRIERYWRDVFYGYTGALYNVFASLEVDGYLNIDDPKHIYILHQIFLPRMNQNLETFRRAWNNHPISTERNYTPLQIMILSIPPSSFDLELNETELRDIHFLCNSLDDLNQLSDTTEDTITAPLIPENCLTTDEIQRFRNIDILRQSSNLGYDIFVESIRCLE